MERPTDIGAEVLPGDIKINTTYYLQRLNPSFTKVVPTAIRTYTLEKDHTFYEIDFVGVDNKEVNWTCTNALPNGQYNEGSLLTNKLFYVDPFGKRAPLLHAWNSAE